MVRIEEGHELTLAPIVLDEARVSEMIAVLSRDEKKPEAKPVFASKQASRKTRPPNRYMSFIAFIFRISGFCRPSVHVPRHSIVGELR